MSARLVIPGNFWLFSSAENVHIPWRELFGFLISTLYPSRTSPWKYTGNRLHLTCSPPSLTENETLSGARVGTVKKKHEIIFSICYNVVKTWSELKCLNQHKANAPQPSQHTFSFQNIFTTLERSGIWRFWPDLFIIPPLSFIPLISKH